jgi:hypothetical protein
MIEYRFKVPIAAIFTLYSYSKALEYPFRVPTVDSLRIRNFQDSLTHRMFDIYMEH